MEFDGPEEWHVAPGDLEDSADSEDSADLEDPWADYGADAGDRARRSRSVRREVLGGNSVRLTAIVALGAALAGVALGVALLHWPGATAAAAPSAWAPASAAAPAPSSGSGSAGSGGGLPALPPLSGNGTGGLQMMLAGKVLAVSGRSITIGGNGASVTAAFTSSTRFGGKVTSAAGIKTGDEVSAAVTGTPAKLTVATIQDPASVS